jgi:hypothetical protein
MAEIGLWILGGALIYAGVETIRKGFGITKRTVIKGTGAKVIGIAIILIGLGLAVGASIYLRVQSPF